MIVHELGPEDVMSCGHGGVGGEHRRGSDQLEGGIERDAACHQLAATFENLEGGVPLVDVPDGRFHSERAQSPHSADTEHDGLGDAHAGAATIE